MMRAIRYRYFARSEGASDDQPFSNAARAALTARSTSCSFACGDLGELLLGRRRDRVEPLARLRLDELAADEEAVALLELDDVARLGRGRVLPLGQRRDGGVRACARARPSVQREVVGGLVLRRSSACGSASARRSGATRRRSGRDPASSTRGRASRAGRRGTGPPASRCGCHRPASSRRPVRSPRRRRGSPRACRA